MTRSRKRIGQILVEAGLMTDEDLAKILSYNPPGKKRFGQKALELGLLSEINLFKALSFQLDLPLIPFESLPSEPPVLPLLTKDFLKHYLFFPISDNDHQLVIAVADPLDKYLLDDLALTTGKTIIPLLCLESDIIKAIELYMGSGASAMEMIIDNMAEEELDLISVNEEESIDALRDMAQEAPVIKLVNLFITQAVERGASDIHIEPFEGELRLRYRIDGVLHDEESPPSRLQAAIISRVKIMAEMNIAERRLPQDGRIRIRVSGKKIDLRVSTVPTMYGESIVMRILDKESIMLDLDGLGFPKTSLKAFQRIISQPHGILLVTGPTGSGKTTTLYAALDKINSPDKKIITIEDPVEYQLRGVNQIQIKPKIGLTFASGLRSIVRQDPDVMMIGEIRDFETAEIAVQSALTGHLVFSTLHTNDAPSAITRLQDMGVESFLISSCLEGVLAQRLIRVICPECKVKTKIDPQVLDEIKHKMTTTGTIVTYKGIGCEHCGQTGFRGRSGIFELMIVEDEIEDLILKKTNSSEIKKTAIEHGMLSLRMDGFNKAMAGITSIDEVIRVTQDEMLMLE
ncbi:type II secretion system ATPase GspE [bacterium]|nr:type II secretion system ATPase GspE [bacterium]